MTVHTIIRHIVVGAIAAVVAHHIHSVRIVVVVVPNLSRTHGP